MKRVGDMNNREILELLNRNIKEQFEELDEHRKQIKEMERLYKSENYSKEVQTHNKHIIEELRQENLELRINLQGIMETALKLSLKLKQ